MRCGEIAAHLAYVCGGGEAGNSYVTWVGTIPIDVTVCFCGGGTKAQQCDGIRENGTCGVGLNGWMQRQVDGHAWI